MMKRFFVFALLFAVLCVSCGKTCRCYRRDGNVDEFDMADLDAAGISCEEKESINFGYTYSLCERVTF